MSGRGWWRSLWRRWTEDPSRSVTQRAAYVLACTRWYRGTVKGNRLLHYAFGLQR
jgi:hypothetical protein